MEEMKFKPHSSKIKRLLNDLDWDCQDYVHHKASLNILHWFPASFITAIPGNIIDIFTNPGDVVWDPFCGSGTTALESFRKGRHFYGNDISEIAILLTRSKLLLIENPDKSEKEIDRLISEIQQLEFNLSFNVSYDKFSEIAKEMCTYDELKFWYSKKTLNDLLLFRTFLEEYKYGKMFKPVFFLLFLNIAKLACAQQKTWGHIADNVLPDEDQISGNRYNVFQAYIKKLYQVREQLKRILIVNHGSKYQVKLADARKYTPPFQADIVITSPPYPSMADYITSQRLDYYWLGYDMADINKFKKQEIGARHLRNHKQKDFLYLENMKLCFLNIIKNLRREGLIVFVLPDYKDTDSRKIVISEMVAGLNSLLNLQFYISRNISENGRWSPFKSLEKESLYIWSKK